MEATVADAAAASAPMARPGARWTGCAGVVAAGGGTEAPAEWSGGCGAAGGGVRGATGSGARTAAVSGGPDRRRVTGLAGVR
ncbi:hypothetical protein GCM10010279_16230 [Streptomyces mutabilis]|nr:hypothetical protein GCM10010279_16230 [Streptomyces mutabilis]